MAAYAISEVTIHDPGKADRYRAVAQATIEQYGGRYLVRGALPEVVQGEWPDDARLVIAEFPDGERLREWFASPEYAEALAIAETALSRRLLFAEGVER